MGDTWSSGLARAFQDLRPEPLPTASRSPAPRGTVEGQRLGATAVYRVAGTPQVVRRTPVAVRREPGGLIKACVQLAGTATLHQDGREVVIQPGQLTVYDTGRPYAIRFEGQWSSAVLAVPPAALGLSASRLSDALHRVISSRQGPGLVFAGYVAAAAGRGMPVGPAAARLGDAGAVLLGGALLDDAGPGVVDAAAELRARIIGYLRTRLGDPELTRSSIAAAHHLSVRTLDRLFAGQPLGVAALIRTERLHAADRDLRDPRLAHCSVATLAARWCFFDAAQFSRQFRQEFGCPPSHVRG